MNISELEKTSLVDLRRTAKEFEIPSGARMKKEDLILRLLQANAERQGLELRGGILEIVDEGIGFLRADHYLPGQNDIYVSQSQIRRFSLRTGDMVIGQVRAPKDTEKYYGLLRVEERSMSKAGKIRRSWSLRDSSSSMLPVPLNSS